MRYSPLAGAGLLGLGLTFAGGTAVAQAPTEPADTLPRRAWYVPHHVLAQVAGGQGWATVGAGYSLSRRRLDLDLLAGYVPGRYSITPMGIFTVKATYMPWTVPLGRSNWSLRPLAVGGHVNYTASRGLNSSRDDKYTDGYYWWSSHTRVGVFAGGRVAYALPTRRAGGPRRRASLYYELGSNDLYLVSWWTNPHELTLGDVLTLGLGVKFDL